MKRRLILVLLSALSAHGFAQLTLDRCHEMARGQYPVIKQYDWVRQTEQYTLANASAAFLPRVQASLGANAFTDVLDLPAQLSAVSGGEMKNHLLNASLQINQLVYDGGATAARKRITKAQSAVDEHQLNVRMYNINRRVDQLFFGILMLDERLKQVKLLQNDLELTRHTVESMQKEGLANQSDVDAVAVEQIKVEQQKSSIVISRQAYRQMLGMFIGQQLTERDTLISPVLTEPWGDNDIHRPELQYYGAQQQLLDQQRKALDAQLRPKLSAFALGMYHNKVMGLMKNEMLAAGVTLSWSIDPFYTRKNDIRNITAKRKTVDNERETFLFNLRLQQAGTQSTVNDLKQKIEQDERIIALRENIHAKSIVKVQNGTETVNEMLRDVNAVGEARQQKAIHEIQLLQEIYQLKNINNN